MIETELRSAEERQQALTRVVRGDVTALVATTSIAGEGLDLPLSTTLFLATPVSGPGLLQQLVGRVARMKSGKERAEVIDYTDSGLVPEAMARKRRVIYAGLGLDVRDWAAARHDDGHSSR